MRFFVLSNINMDPLKKFLPPGDHRFCGYGQYMEELISEDSGLNANTFDVVFMHIDGEEFAKKAFASWDNMTHKPKAVEEEVNLLFAAIRKFKSRHPRTIFIISTFVFSPWNTLTYIDWNSSVGPSAIERTVNARLVKFAERVSHTYVFDWNKIVQRQGYQTLVDNKFWYLGRIKYTYGAFKAISDEIANMLDAVRGQTKKVLVIDLDNTIWGGIIGEDGIDAIQISEDGIGRAYRDFQQAIKSMKDLGVLLAINSKNDLKAAENVFLFNKMMVLQKDDFVAKRINWKNKVENLKEIAEELNLSLDGFVFLDDNPRERSAVRKYLPQVAVPEFPQDPAYLKKWFLEDVAYRYFPKVYLTDEDKDKSVQYQARAKRNSFQGSMNIEEFIRSLSIKLVVYVNDAKLAKRTAQLSQKTNQFNMTTRRYSESDIANFLNDKKIFVFNMDYKDRFGEEGVIAMAIAKGQGDCATLDSFLLSCRVIGKKVEFAFFYYVMKYLHAKGYKKITAEFIKTSKNKVAEDFYKEAGLVRKKGREGLAYSGEITTAFLRDLNKEFMIAQHYKFSQK